MVCLRIQVVLLERLVLAGLRDRDGEEDEHRTLPPHPCIHVANPLVTMSRSPANLLVTSGFDFQFRRQSRRLRQHPCL